MKRRIVFLLIGTVLAVSAVTTVGCGTDAGTSAVSENAEEAIEYQDENYLKDMAAGLEARWADSESGNNDYDLYSKEHKEAFTKAVDTELDILSKYESAEFQDSKLKEKALSYINALKDQKEALKYMNVDSEKYETAWENAYNERTKLITEFCNDFGLTVSEKYQSTLDEFLLNAQEVEEKESKEAEVKKFVKSIKFEKVKQDYDWVTYEAVVENTTSINFEFISLDISLLDEDKVIIESSYADVQNFDKGAKAKFSFTTDKKFKKIKIGDYDYAEKE